jgi:hypothetical protein
MSASSPVITIEVGGEGRAGDVCARLRRLYFRRVLWRSIGETTMALACAIAALCLIALADDRWRLPRPARTLLLLIVLLPVLFVLARTVLVFTHRRRLADLAREDE